MILLFPDAGADSTRVIPNRPHGSLSVMTTPTITPRTGFPTRLLLTFAFVLGFALRLGADTPPLTISQNHVQTSDGTPVRFWGINLVAAYPTHTEADGIAANLAAREINLVRLHHNLRSSLDWNTVSGIPALVTYQTDSRTPHTEAWDRFDYLNAQLRSRGIYLLLSLHSSRRFLAGDVDILTTDATDRTNWMNAMTALNSMSGNLDLFKCLPMLDERCAQLMEEFAQRLLTHVNPYTGIAYGSDPQVVFLETMNEHSFEYAIVAGNKFQSTTYPAVSYFSTELQAKWDAYTTVNAVTPCDIYAPSTTAQKLARGDFLRGLDQTYFNRIKTFVRGLGCQTPIEYSNLWRGEAFQKLEESVSDVVEEHDYADPLTPRTYDDAFNYFSRSTPVGKPYFVGEFNQGVTDSTIAANVPYRATMQVAASAYGSFNDWAGITWFAWSHGDKMIGNDGWSIWEERRPAVNSDMIGQIESDGVMLDHLRTAGLIFKRGLVAPSAQPQAIYADDPLGATNYPSLMSPKYQYQAGWQNIYAMKRAFGPVPASQPGATWMTTAPANPLLSDTGEILKDVTRQQLTVTAAQAEEFSGVLDGLPPASLNHLGLGTASGAATVILVANDGQPIATSEHLVLSRTYFDSSGNEVANPVTTLSQIKAPSGTSGWFIKRTRPRGETGYEEVPMSSGVLNLPTDGWHEAELAYAAAGSLPSRQSLAQVGDVLRPVFDDAYRIAGVLATSAGGFTRNAQSVIDPSTTFTPAEGSKSLRMKFTAGFDPCVLGIAFTNSAAQAAPLDLTPWQATHGLRFWVYTKRLVSSFSVELACLNGTQLVEVRVPLSNYLQPAQYGNQWVEVTVPFSAFPSTDSSNNTFLWNQVKGIGFYCSTVTDGYYDPYIDNLRIVRTSTAGPTAPVAPTGLTATAGNANVALSWSAVAGATSYNVKRTTGTGGTYAVVGTTSGTTYSDTTVTNGTVYTYVVSASNAVGEGPDSSAVSATPQALPAAPTGLVATAGNGQVSLSWSAVSGATGYTVKRSTVTGGPYAVIATVTASPYVDSTVVNGTTYAYVLSATNASGEGSNSAEVTATPLAPPAAPADLTASAGDGLVTLTWSAVTGATSYNVKRATVSGGPYSLVTTLATAGWTDTAVTNGTTYRYVVSSLGAGGEGVNSSEVTATPMPASVPAAPTGLVANAGNAQISLSWTAAAGATSYTLKRATSASGPFAAVASLSITSYSDTTVTNGTAYTYVVAATNARGDSGDSSAVTATPQGSAQTVTVTLVSIGAEDGFVQESSQTSGVGGGFNATSATSQAMIIGDTNSNRQNKTIVSFDTSVLPTGATIVAVTLKLRRSALVGTNPFLSLGNCGVDLAVTPGFGGSTALAAADFQAAADVALVATMSNPANNLDWSVGSLNQAGIDAISRTGETQLRVAFAIGDNNNASNDYVASYSGENATAANRPVLEITYLPAP